MKINMNRLIDLIEVKVLYQIDISKYFTMSKTGYSQYEIETNDIPTEVLKKLALFYDTSIDYLLCLTDERKPYPKSFLE